MLAIHVQSIKHTNHERILDVTTCDDGRGGGRARGEQICIQRKIKAMGSGIYQASIH